jgi:hypothetical protein
MGKVDLTAEHGSIAGFKQIWSSLPRILKKGEKSTPPEETPFVIFPGAFQLMRY